MCYITATEFKKNLGHYMKLSEKEDIYVTKNNKVITVLTNADRHRLAILDEIDKEDISVPEDIDYDALLWEALKEKCMS